MNDFMGFFPEGAASIVVSILNDVNTPVDPSINPTYRIYEAGILVPGATGSLAKCDTHTITAASNTNPIQITTSAAHGLQTGDRVTIASVGGNAAANGTWTITRISDTIYSLNGSAGDGAYTSGGTGHVTGIYKISLTLGSGTGFTSGKAYRVVINWTDTAARSMMGTFIMT